MPSAPTYTNPGILPAIVEPKPGWKVNGDYYDYDEWDMHVSMEPKPKPFEVGDVVLHDMGSNWRLLTVIHALVHGTHAVVTQWGEELMVVPLHTLSYAERVELE